jgi:membrane fusion protein, multidrug efflux system
MSTDFPDPNIPKPSPPDASAPIPPSEPKKKGGLFSGIGKLASFFLIPLKLLFKLVFKILGGLFSSVARIRMVIIVVAAAVGLLIVRQVFFPKEKEVPAISSAQAADSQRVPVKVFKVGRFNFEDSLNSLGNIKGMVEFKLSFEIPGVISAINYREGEYYEEGALLISLRQDDILLRLKRSQAQRQKALSAMYIGEDKYKEHETLFEIGAIPESTLDRVRHEFDQAKFEAEAATIEMKANEAVLEKSNIYAPSAGTIGELNIEEGEAITQNTLVGTHVRTDRVVAIFGVTERDVNKISLGQRAKVFLDAYPDKTFEGIIENIAPVIVGTSRTADVRVRIENPEGLMLAGMFARIKILLYQKKNTLVVPTDALLGKENEQYVYLIDPDEKITSKAPIVVGYQRVDYAQIDSGIREEDLVVVSGMDRLEEGTTVRIIETQEAEL